MKSTDQAILLNRISYGETSLILTFYTLKSGIQKFIFQGGKKKAHQLFPLGISEITYYKRPDSDLGKLTAVESGRMLSEIPFNPIKSSIAFFIAEILQKCLKTEEAEENLFHFLEERILFLDKNNDIVFFPIEFLLNFSLYMGIYPNKESKKDKYFNIMEGTFENDIPLSGDIYYEGPAIQLLSDIIDGNTTSENKEFNTKINRSKSLDILLHYYQLHIPQFKEINSLEVIREIL